MFFLALIGSSAGWASAQEQTNYPNLLGQHIETAARTAEELGIELTVQLQEGPEKKGLVLDQIPGPLVELDSEPRMFTIVADGLVIPRLKGKNADNERAKLQQKGFTVFSSERPLEGIPKGNIAYVTPREGDRIDPHSQALFLTVSTQHLVRIPADLVGRRRHEIRALPDVAYTDDIHVSNGSPCRTPDVYNYFATQSTPAPGTLVAKGSTVAVNYRTVFVRAGESLCTPSGVIR